MDLNRNSPFMDITRSPMDFWNFWMKYFEGSCRVKIQHSHFIPVWNVFLLDFTPSFLDAFFSKLDSLINVFFLLLFELVVSLGILVLAFFPSKLLSFLSFSLTIFVFSKLGSFFIFSLSFICSSVFRRSKTNVSFTRRQKEKYLMVLKSIFPSEN